MKLARALSLCIYCATLVYMFDEKTLNGVLLLRLYIQSNILSSFDICMAVLFYSKFVHSFLVRFHVSRSTDPQGPLAGILAYC